MISFTFLLLAAAQDPAETITDLDLEDLMNVRVTSPQRKAQTVSDVPAAVHVIRGEDLRRSGALTLPEALRVAAWRVRLDPASGDLEALVAFQPVEVGQRKTVVRAELDLTGLQRGRDR